jgi:4-hydroxybenzoate polyprenyltransferase
MFSRSTWLHLRIPFSFFLLPIFLFSLGISPNFNAIRVFWVFIIVHFLLYPASNGYNSYFDRDESSIGALRNPPPVQHGLYILSLLLDALAVVLGYLEINIQFALMLLVYGLISKAYSHPSIRLKKYPILGWVAAGVFQGMFTLLMCYIGINDFPLELALNQKTVYAGLLATAMLLGNYPMTQIYQHKEDAKRGDLTISRLLGVQGTFYFVGIVFSLVFLGFVLYFATFFSSRYSLFFTIALIPEVIFFIRWIIRVRQHVADADYDNTMRLNFISSFCLNVFFLFLFIESNHILYHFFY